MKKINGLLKTNKCNKTAFVLKLLVSGVLAAITVYTLIPKHDKIAGIDTNAFIEAQKARQNVPCESGTVEKPGVN